MADDIKDRIKAREGELKNWQAQLSKLNGARVLVIDKIARTEGALEELRAQDKGEDKTGEK